MLNRTGPGRADVDKFFYDDRVCVYIYYLYNKSEMQNTKVMQQNNFTFVRHKTIKIFIKNASFKTYIQI